jgi:ribosome-interacting GTPase 1
VTLTERWRDAEAADDDPFARQLPTLILANKADTIPDIDAELKAFLELGVLRYPALAVCATTGRGLDEVGAWLFENLGIVRVYTKAPGHPPDKGRPFTLRRGETVDDLARLIHQDLVRTLKYARIWGHSGFDGQHVGHEHVLADRDVVELHS